MNTEPLSREQAEALYHEGLERTVTVLVTLSATLEATRAENTKLLSDNEELRARLGAATAICPSTPSGAIPPFHKPNRPAGKRRRRPGRKKGHPGTTRKSPERIDRELSHAPVTYCPECTGLLDPDSTEIRERLIEGVLAAAAEVVCHLVPYRYCPSCQKHFGPAVLEAMPRDHISLYTYVLTAWLHYRTGLSMKSSVELLRHSGLEITKGGLAQGWQRLAGHLRPAYDQILEKVKSSLVLMADETGWRIRGVTYWLWYFGTRLWSYYIIDRRRGTGVVNKVLGEIIEGILITDFWGAYNAIDAWAKQRCLFHLFTELRKVDLRNNSPPWRSFRRRLYRIFRDAIRLVGNQDIDQPTFQRRKARIDTRLDNLLDEPTQDKDAQRLIKRLRRHRNEMLTFLDFAPIVSPYNNHSEQEMRGPVICRRISQGNRSLAGAQTQAILMSLFRSAELQGWDPVQYVLKLVQDSIAGCPSVLPPAPDAAEQIADVA